MLATASAADLASYPCDIGPHALRSRRRQAIARCQRGMGLGLPDLVQHGDAGVTTCRTLSTGCRRIRRPLHVACAAELRRAEPAPVAASDRLADRDDSFEAMLARDGTALRGGRVVGDRSDAAVGPPRSGMGPRPETKPQFECGPRDAA